jgi:hypothetical protein
MTKIALVIAALFAVNAIPPISYDPAINILSSPPGIVKESTAINPPQRNVFPRKDIQPGLVFKYATNQLWADLRLGLAYLESPKPLDLPEAVPPAYVHPDGKGFGAYGFSPAAYADVQRLYPFFKQYRWEDVLKSPKLYELANQAFADWLLKNMRSEIGSDMDFTVIFNNLHQAWNLGLSGFKQGRRVVSSRIRRATEFLNKQTL